MADLSKLQEITRKRKWYEIGHYSAEEKRLFYVPYILLIIPVLHIIVFYFYIHMSSFALAFTNTHGEFTLGNFQTFFRFFFNGQKDMLGLDFNTSLKNSVFIYWTGFIIGNTIGLTTTYMLTKHMIGHKVFRTILHIPGLVGGVVSAIINIGLYDWNGPVLEVLIAIFGKESFAPAVLKNGLLGHSSTAFMTMCIRNWWGSIGGGSMILAGAFMRIPQEVFEAANLDGCGFIRETFQIAIPCAWPTISTSLLFGLCGMFTADLSFYTYSGGTGAYGMTSIGFYLYKFQAMISGADVLGGEDYSWLYGYISAVGMVLTIITIPFAFLGRVVLSKLIEDVSF